jgi:hypothetical protein
MLASLLFPYDDDAPKLIDEWLTELETENCIARYSVAGDAFIEIRKWLQHQKIDKPSPSKIPPFDEHSRTFAKVREHSSLDQGPRTKDQGEDQGPKEASASVANATTAAGISVEEFFGRWQKFAETKSLPVPRRLSAGLKAKIDSRLKSVEWFTDFKAAIAKLPLGGDWQPDLVWLVANDDNAGKVASGKYDNWKKNGHAEPKPEQPPTRIA